MPTPVNRRNFLKASGMLTTGVAAFSLLPVPACSMNNPNEEGLNIVGPIKGYSPQVGTLVTMLNWMHDTMLAPVHNMSVEQLDYHHDAKSNSIGSMLLHLAAAEIFYQLHTFEGKKWGNWSDAIKSKWDVPMNLGEPARKTIKGKPLDYYLNTLGEVREHTLTQLKSRDDQWLLSVDKDWFWGPTNNYCKWFHVCEHESNHNGQIKWIKSRLG